MELKDLPTTDSGAIRKEDAMKWLKSLDSADGVEDLHDSVVVQPYEHEGSTFDEPFSQIRVSGTAEFITEVARRFTSFVEFESGITRLSINLQRVEDRDTGEIQDNVFVLYLSVAERG